MPALSEKPQGLMRRTWRRITDLFRSESEAPSTEDAYRARKARAEALSAEENLREMTRERIAREMIARCRRVLFSQAGAQGNYVNVTDLAKHLEVNADDLQECLVRYGHQDFEQIGDRLYLRGHVNG